MQSVRNSILRHINLRNCAESGLLTKCGSSLSRSTHQMCSSACANSERLMVQIIGIIKKYDWIDPGKVTEKADFQKDLCLESLDRVELFMAIEQEFNIEIPDDKAEKLTCCADVVKYIMSEADQKLAENS